VVLQVVFGATVKVEDNGVAGATITFVSISEQPRPDLL
jgi:hypothetical protein